MIHQRKGESAYVYALRVEAQARELRERAREILPRLGSPSPNPDALGGAGPVHPRECYYCGETVHYAEHWSAEYDSCTDCAADACEGGEYSEEKWLDDRDRARDMRGVL